MVKVSSQELATLLGGELLGRPDCTISRIKSLEAADASSIAFLSNARYQAQLDSTQAACVIVAAAQRERAARLPSAIVCADPYLAFARLTQWWALRTRPAAVAGVHATAVVDAAARVDATASIGAYAVIGADVRIDEGAVIGPHTSIGDGASIGPLTRLGAHVVFGHGCSIGARGIVHGGVVIGADGFGFAPHEGQWVKIEQLGAVRIGDDVEIGANTCIDRGALEDTVIEDGVKLDNLIQVGHNVFIGAHTAMAGCVGIAGSARIGRGCTVGGGAIILGHLELVDGVHVSAATVITRSIRKPGQYSGVFPFDDNAAWEKNAATLRQLHAMRERLKALERAMETGPK